MWYFTWIIGLGFAVILAVAAALWLELQDDARNSQDNRQD